MLIKGYFYTPYFLVILNMHPDLEKMRSLLEEIDESEADEKIWDAYSFADGKLVFDAARLAQMPPEVREKHDAVLELRERIAQLTVQSESAEEGACQHPLCDQEARELMELYLDRKIPDVVKTLLHELEQKFRKEELHISKKDEILKRALIVHFLTEENAVPSHPDRKNAVKSGDKYDVVGRIQDTMEFFDPTDLNDTVRECFFGLVKRHKWEHALQVLNNLRIPIEDLRKLSKAEREGLAIERIKRDDELKYLLDEAWDSFRGYRRELLMLLDGKMSARRDAEAKRKAEEHNRRLAEERQQKLN